MYLPSFHICDILLLCQDWLEASSPTRVTSVKFEGYPSISWSKWEGAVEVVRAIRRLDWIVLDAGTRACTRLASDAGIRACSRLAGSDAGIRPISRDLATVPLCPSNPYSDRPLLNERLLASCLEKEPFKSLFLFRPLESPPHRHTQTLYQFGRKKT